MNTAEQQPGDALRDEAANLLTHQFGPPIREARVMGKKADLAFTYRHFGKPMRVYLEAKDWQRPLTRSEVVHIWADYSGIVESNAPADLLIVTRHGLSPDAQAFVLQEQKHLRHQTIWEVENDTLSLTDYVRSLEPKYQETKLADYYVPAKGCLAEYSSDGEERFVLSQPVDLFNSINTWIAQVGDSKPVAILGGYGAGKTSFAIRLASHQANIALREPTARRPILIKLGEFTRFSSLEGILGGMFNSEFAISGFNVPVLHEFNRKGRFLIVLDGFDEMKHAMTWTDFRAQVSELNKLIVPGSKVILLGRPAAFLSMEEHVHVLRGRKRILEGWRRMREWPEFTEYDLQSFTPAERSDFVKRYLASAMTQDETYQLSASQIEARAQQVNRLADQDHEVFSKPVHAKILTDLAADPNVDISRFENGMSRWDLYNAFFQPLMERETEKEARRPITEVPRSSFLEELSYWLWTEKDGTTSFSAAEIPVNLLSLMPDGGAVDDDAKAREYLSGTFLEKKSGDIFYFGHRSFAEFLVAKRMTHTPPTAAEHARYSHLLRDGVKSFLSEGGSKDILGAWTTSLSRATGSIRLNYISFLAEKKGSFRDLVRDLDRGSIWHELLQLFGQTITFGPVLENNLFRALPKAGNVLSALILRMLDANLTFGGGLRQEETYVRLAAILMDKFFGQIFGEIGFLEDAPSLRDPRYFGRFTLDKLPGKSYVSFNGFVLMQRVDELLRAGGIDLEIELNEERPGLRVKRDLRVQDVVSFSSLRHRRQVSLRLSTGSSFRHDVTKRSRSFGIRLGEASDLGDD
ncbi:MAG TPA: hypothetical protein VGW40_03170 [Allosphingosinicella sp.]|nr:hypothetical protein [Allosphingosinicella sp.]